MSAPATRADKLALFWLNSLVSVPSALLVSSLDELTDTHVLCDLVRELQRKHCELHPGAGASADVSTLSASIKWLGETFGYSSLPTELASPGVEARVRSGHMLTIVAFVTYLKDRMNEIEMLSERGGLGAGSRPLFASHFLSSSTNAPNRSTALRSASPRTRATEAPRVIRAPEQQGAATTTSTPHGVAAVTGAAPPAFSMTNAGRTQTLAPNSHHSALPSRPQSQPRADARTAAPFANSVHAASTLPSTSLLTTPPHAPPSTRTDFPRANLLSSSIARGDHNPPSALSRVPTADLTWAAPRATSPGRVTAALATSVPSQPATAPAPRQARVYSHLPPALVVEPSPHAASLRSPTPSSLQGPWRRAASNAVTDKLVAAMSPGRPFSSPLPISTTSSASAAWENPYDALRGGSSPLPKRPVHVNVDDGAQSEGKWMVHGFSTSTIADPLLAGCGARHLAVLRWLQWLGVDATVAGRESYSAASLPLDTPAFLAVPYLLADGIMLNEIVVAAETRLGNRLQAAEARVPVDALVTGADKSGLLRAGDTAAAGISSSGQKKIVLQVLPGAVLPRHGLLPHTAAVKNWELALSLLRNRPKVASRHLWDADVFCRVADEAAAWELLHDIFRGYSVQGVAPRSKSVARASSRGATVRGEMGAHSPSAQRVTHSAAHVTPEVIDARAPQAHAARLQQAPPNVTYVSADASRDDVATLSAGVRDLTLSSASVVPALMVAQRVQAPAQPAPPAVATPSSSALVDAVARNTRPAAGVPAAPTPAPPARSVVPPPPARAQPQESSVTRRTALDSVVGASMPAGTRSRVPLLPLVTHAVKLPSEVASRLAEAGMLAQKASASAPDRVRVQPVSALRKDECLAWLRSMGLAGLLSVAPRSAPHVLDDALLNGVLLVELVRRLEPDQPPLAGAYRMRHFAKTRSLPEARANIEAALAVLRASPVACGRIVVDLHSIAPASGMRPEAAPPAAAPHVPLELLWCTEELLLGNTAAGWALIAALHDVYTWAHSHGARTGETVASSTDAVSTKDANAITVAVSAPSAPRTPQRENGAASARASPPGEGSGMMPGTGYASSHLRTTFIPDMEPVVSAELEAQLLEWVNSLARSGCLRTLPHALPGIVSLCRRVADGTLLCDVAAMLQRRPIHGVVMPVPSTVVAANNIHKALDALRLLPNVSRRVLSDPAVEALLVAGHVSTSLRLMQDCYRAYHGLAPVSVSSNIGGSRSGSVRHTDADDLAASLRVFSPAARRRRAVSAPRDGGSPSTGASPDAVRESVARGGDRGSSAADAAGVARIPVHVRSASAARASQSPPLLRTAAARNSGETEAVAADDLLLPQPGTDSLEPSGTQPRAPAASGKDDARSVAGMSLSSALTRQTGMSSAAAHDAHKQRLQPTAPRLVAAPVAPAAPAAAAARAGVLRPAASAAAPGDKVAAEVDAIARWMRHFDVPMPDPSQLLATSGSAPDFSDGVLLARLVEACENLRGTRRGDLCGVDKNPRTGAARLANIRRCLEVLRENKSMPLDYLWSELQIRSGDPRVVRGLLLHMRKAYGPSV